MPAWDCQASPMSVISALRTTARPSAAFVIIGLYWGTMAAHYPVFKDRLGVDDATFGILLLGSALGLVSSMWLAPRIDRVLGARAMQVAALAFVAVFILPTLATTPVGLALSMLALGSASGLLDVVMNARVSELEALHRRPLMNASHAMFSLAYAVAAVFAGVMREGQVDPTLTFGLVAAACLGIALWLRMAPARAEGEEQHANGGYPLVPILICGGIVLVAFMSEATVEAWSALHVERTLNGGAVQGALGPAMLGATMAFGRFSGQVVSERLRDVTVIHFAATLSASGALIAAAAPTPAIAYLGFGVLGLGVSVIGPIGLAIVGRLVPGRMRTEAISRVAVMGFSGFFLAPVLMGQLSQIFGLRIAFASVAALLLIAVPLALAAGRLEPRR
jgi:MFS family permease